MRKLAVLLTLMVSLLANHLSAQTYQLGATATYTTCSGTVYDSGGPGGDYSNNEYSEIRFITNSADHIFRLEFTSFDLAPGDYLYVYNGPYPMSPLLGAFTGNTLPPVLYATNPAGYLYLYLQSNASGVGTGFAATLTCLPVYHDQVFSCGPYTWSNGTTHAFGGTYRSYDVLTGSLGQDSVATLDLTIQTPPANKTLTLNDNEHACSGSSIVQV